MVSLPEAVGVPGMPLLTPEASVTSPVLSPPIVAASFVPVIVMVTCWVFELPVPSLATTS